ncbi:MAG: DUF2807 domain-containing protein [Bacteroidetes bacterium]|nr:MAG: DUF2807 domain-containing protein [Bacteroidota bacterium]
MIFMKKFVYLLILSCIALNFSSCEKIKGKGDVVAQIRNITGFNGISLAIDATVYFSPDTSFYVEVRAQQNILDILETVIGPNNTLIIRYKSGVIVGTHEPIKIFIAAPCIQLLTISGSGDILVDTPWHNQYLQASISGSGNIQVSQVEAAELQVTISGSGNVLAITGEVSYQVLKISGSGNIDLEGVTSDTTYTTISGSGNITVWVTTLLDATISGSGNVYYKGDPTINTHISGSGSVIKI